MEIFYKNMFFCKSGHLTFVFSKTHAPTCFKHVFLIIQIKEQHEEEYKQTKQDMRIHKAQLQPKQR